MKHGKHWTRSRGSALGELLFWTVGAATLAGLIYVLVGGSSAPPPGTSEEIAARVSPIGRVMLAAPVGEVAAGSAEQAPEAGRPPETPGPEAAGGEDGPSGVTESAESDVVASETPPVAAAEPESSPEAPVAEDGAAADRPQPVEAGLATAEPPSKEPETAGAPLQAKATEEESVPTIPAVATPASAPDDTAEAAPTAALPETPQGVVEAGAISSAVDASGAIPASDGPVEGTGVADEAPTAGSDGVAPPAAEIVSGEGRPAKGVEAARLVAPRPAWPQPRTRAEGPIATPPGWQPQRQPPYPMIWVPRYDLPGPLRYELRPAPPSSR